MSAYYWEGTRVRLRAVEPEDWAAHFVWDQDSELSRRLDYVWFPHSQETARQWAARTSTLQPESDTFHFEIETLAGELVGSISTHHCDARQGTFEYGLAILPDQQRRGYASEAIRLVLGYFFDELRYQKVTVHVYSFNEPSIGLHERLGFAREARIRRTIFTDGAYHDDLVFGLTGEEFAAATAAGRWTR